MIVVGLTGSIAMGKSETAKLFAARGIPVFDSDAAVHALYAKGGEAVGPVSALAPSAIERGSVNRVKLAALVQAEPDLLKKIEAAVHPMVKAKQQAFLSKARASLAEIVVLDIPLLFETQRAGEVDVIVVVSAAPAVQRQRALARPGMTAEKLNFILARQVADSEKRARADYVIDTSVSLEETAKEVDRVIVALKKEHSGAST
jgi:dephospho-CoA kinase